ncbi:MAG: MFS transporter, partial [Dehalococcoidia bacterium]
MSALPSSDAHRLQRRTLAVLAVAQVFGGIGVASGIAVGALLIADIGRESLSGLASSSTVLGAALAAVPVARYMSAHGRRRGLLLAYLVGTLGVLLVVSAAVLRLFPLAIVGLVLAGSGTAAGLQSRYAAVDLADSTTRGRSLSTVVWATTVGSVLGPNLAQPMGQWAAGIGMPPLAGPFMLSSVAFVTAAVIIGLLLRPDPLLAARALAGGAGAGAAVPEKRSIGAVLAGIAGAPSALLGLLAMAVGHAVMVGVMSMTPVHLQHGGASLRIVGLVISGHIAGMYIASPLVGWLADRFGRHTVIMGGGAILLTSFWLAGTATGHESTQLAIGLFLLGLGWSCTLIGGS